MLLIGPSGSGKTTFARRHFRGTEVVSSDECRALAGDDESDMNATQGAFRILNAIVRERLRAGRLVVVDATNVRADKRAGLLKLARARNRPAVAIAFELPETTYLERNRHRPDRNIPDHAVVEQIAQMKAGAGGLESEGYVFVYRLDGSEAIAGAEVRVSGRA